MCRFLKLALAVLLLASARTVSAQALSNQWFVVDTIGQDYLGQISAWKPANVAVSNGLTITDQLQTVQAGNANLPLRTTTYTTGMLAANSFSFTYGDIAYRAAFPQAAKGVWSILFLLGQNCSLATKLASETNLGGCYWPTPGSDEIDLTEILYNSSANNINQQIHTGAHNDGCNPTITDINTTNLYETFWAAGSLTFYINGSLTCTITQAYVPSTPMQLIIWSAVHSGPSATFPQTMTVQYVRVCPTATAVGDCTQAHASIFDEEFTGTGGLANVYVAQTFKGAATGVDCANAFGMFNYQQASWLQDSGNFSNGQIGPGTTVHLCGNWTTTPVISGSGTGGSPITVAYEPGAYGPCPSTDGQTNIVFTGSVCPQAASLGAVQPNGTIKLSGSTSIR